MKHLKTMGLAALAAIAVLAFLTAGTASATELYSGATTLKSGTAIKASLSGSATLTTTEGTVLDTCAGGEVNGNSTNNGGPDVPVKGAITALTWTNCTEPTKTLRLANLEIYWTSGLNGTVVAANNSEGKSTEVTVNTTFFGSCVFTMPDGKIIGTLTGSTTTNATFDINATANRVSGLCPSTAKWVGTYKVTSPSPLHVTAS